MEKVEAGTGATPRAKNRTPEISRGFALSHLLQALASGVVGLAAEVCGVRMAGVANQH